MSGMRIQAQVRRSEASELRGQGSRLIDRVSGSSQPGASPVVPNSPSRGGEGAIQIALVDAKHGGRAINEDGSRVAFFIRLKLWMAPRTMTTMCNKVFLPFITQLRARSLLWTTYVTWEINHE